MNYYQYNVSIEKKKKRSPKWTERTKSECSPHITDWDSDAAIFPLQGQSPLTGYKGPTPKEVEKAKGKYLWQDDGLGSGKDIVRGLQFKFPTTGNKLKPMMLLHMLS